MCAADDNYCFCLAKTLIVFKNGLSTSTDKDHNENDIKSSPTSSLSYGNSSPKRRASNRFKSCSICSSSLKRNLKRDVQERYGPRALSSVYEGVNLIFQYTTRTLVSSIPSTKGKVFAIHCLLVLISFICYANSFHGDFVHDDISAITTNPDVIGKNSLIEVFRNDYWGTPMSSPVSHKSYRPLTTLTFR